MTDCQKCLLLRLLEKRDLSTNEAGWWLNHSKLLKKNSAYTSNRCFPGSAVLRSLELRGLAKHFLSSRDEWAIKKYYLTEKGREVAETLAKGDANAKPE